MFIFSRIEWCHRVLLHVHCCVHVCCSRKQVQFTLTSLERWLQSTTRWAQKPVIHGMTWGPYKWKKKFMGNWCYFTLLTTYCLRYVWGFSIIYQYDWPLSETTPKFCHDFGVKLKLTVQNKVSDLGETGGLMFLYWKFFEVWIQRQFSHSKVVNELSLRHRVNEVFFLTMKRLSG